MAVKTYKKGSATKVSENFRIREFDCNGTGCCTETKIDSKLVNYLQNIRDHFGAKVTIASGYRCPEHNGNVPNAAKQSKHMFGTAADIKVDGVEPIEVAKYAESIGVKGIGLYDTFVHIDTRENKSFWYGHKQEYRSTFGGIDAQKKFIMDVQEAIGANVDGIAGRETLSKTPTISYKKNERHDAVEVIQKHLYSLGYSVVGDADGIAGILFDKAVKEYQADHDCVIDGEITSRGKTWRKLLGME